MSLINYQIIADSVDFYKDEFSSIESQDDGSHQTGF